jgi:hypothetical protein
MNLITGIIVVVVACMLMALLGGVSYWVITKPVKDANPMFARADLNALMTQYQNADKTASYSNVADVRMASPGDGRIMVTAALDWTSCKALCGGTKGCNGFQTKAGTCELLSNVGNTFAFTDTGTILTTVLNVTPQKAFDSALTNQGIIGFDLITTPGSSKEECAISCMETTNCKGFSLSTTSGCHLKSDVTNLLPDPTYTTYILKGVDHT